MDLAQFAETLRKSRRGLPKSPDGLSDAQAASRTEGKQDDEAFLLKVVKGINGQVKRGVPLPPSALPSILDAILHAQTSEGIDDRKLLLEHVLALMARLPPGSLQDNIQDAVIGLLYDALPHPPVNFMPTKAMEPKVPTVVKDVPIGPGGAPVSDGKSGGLGAGGPGSGPFGSTTTAPATTSAPAPTSVPAFPTTPPPHSQSGFADTLRSMWPHNEPTQLPTPSTSHFGNGPSSGTSTAGAGQSSGSPPAATTVETNPFLPRKAYSSQFRNPSGAMNNPHLPLLGAAGTAYARSVVPQHPIPASSLPDPSLVFDILMKRAPPPPEADPDSPHYQPDSEIAAKFRGQGHGLPHPSGLSTMLFAFGDIIIHSLFRTSKDDTSVNLTSSYLDLSPLYGVDEKEMDTVRRNDGTGRIWEDVWADPRIALMPPQVGAVLVVFSRNHNFLALRLLEINENQKYVAPKFAPPKSNAITGDQLFPTLDEAKRTTQDDDIFNRARLINCVFFMNVILGDYLSGILGTFRDASEWFLNPLEEIRKGGKTITNRAEGNCVSAEFNLLYRWHATLTRDDEVWLEEAIRKLMPHPPTKQQMDSGAKEPTEDDFKVGLDLIAQAQVAGPRTWTFGDLKRTPEGGFADHKLAEILHRATTTVARAYGARGIPPVMKAIETKGIKQAREWGICTMNEFRKFIGLKQYESFEEWNPTPGIADAARMLYGHIDNLELYVGLMCEESKQPGDGAGLCPGYTISRAILSDAVALTRGDRFLTTDLTPAGLTAWGYQDCARDVHNGSMGGMFSKLLFRTVPDYYPEGSIYAHFPFVTPDEMHKWLTNMNLVDQYNFKPLPSDPIRPVVPISSVQGVKTVLGDVGTFRAISSVSMKEITNDYGFFLSFDGEPKQLLGRSMVREALHRKGAIETYSAFCRRELERLFAEKSIPLGGTQRAVNIVRDVINILPVHWVCEEIAGLPLKSTEAPSGIYTEQEMYHRLTSMFEFVFLNDDPEMGWQLKTKAKEYAEELLPYIKGRFARSRGRQSIITVQGLRDIFTHYSTAEVDNSTYFYKALLANNSAGMTTDQLSYHILGFVIAASTQLAQATTNVVDFYLKDEQTDHLAVIKDLIKRETPEAKETLVGYVREALRLNPVIPGVFRRAKADLTVVEKEEKDVHGVKKVEEIPVNILKNDRIFVSIGNANKDPTVFSHPETVNPKRNKADYYYGQYEYTFFDEIFTEHMIPEAIRVIFSKKNLKRGPNSMGQIRTFTNDVYKTKTREYLSVNGNITPFAASLFLTYDVDEAPAK